MRHRRAGLLLLPHVVGLALLISRAEIASAHSFQDFFFQPGGLRTEASAVSSRASAIVGTTPDTGEAFRWTSATGATGLGFLAGFTSSFATTVSADGSIVAGFSSDGSTIQGFAWTQASGMTGLGRPNGDDDTI